MYEQNEQGARKQRCSRVETPLCTAARAAPGLYWLIRPLPTSGSQGPFTWDMEMSSQLATLQKRVTEKNNNDKINPSVFNDRNVNDV